MLRKLAISAPVDQHEREAESVAEQIIRMPSPAIPRPYARCSATGAPCPVGEAEMEGPVLRKIESESGSASSIPDTFLHELGPGLPLDSATGGFMEPRFCNDFSHVRVHTDAHASDSARSVNALAYTVGHDIMFGAGRYQPAITEGKKLLAHELAHVIQQDGGNAVATGKPGPTRKSGLSVGAADVLQRIAPLRLQRKWRRRAGRLAASAP